MDGWMGGCVDVWMGGCVDAWMHGWVDVRQVIHQQTYLGVHVLCILRGNRPLGHKKQASGYEFFNAPHPTSCFWRLLFENSPGTLYIILVYIHSTLANTPTCLAKIVRFASLERNECHTRAVGHKKELLGLQILSDLLL